MSDLPAFLKEEAHHRPSRFSNPHLRKALALGGLVGATCALLVLYFPVAGATSRVATELSVCLFGVAALLGLAAVVLAMARYFRLRRTFDALLAFALAPLVLECLWHATAPALPAGLIPEQFLMLINGRILAGLGLLCLAWLALRDAEFHTRTRASTSLPVALATFALVLAASSVFLPALGVNLSADALRQGRDLLAAGLFFAALLCWVQRFIRTPLAFHWWMCLALVCFATAPLFTLMTTAPLQLFVLVAAGATGLGFVAVVTGYYAAEAGAASRQNQLERALKERSNEAARVEAALDLERELNREKERSLTRQIQDLAHDYAILEQQHEEARSELVSVAEKHEEAERAIHQLASVPRDNPNPVLVADARGQILYTNPAAEALIEEHSGGSAEDFLPERSAEIIRQCIREGISMRFLEAAAGDRVYSWSFHPVEDSSTIHIYVADVTDRVYAEQRLTDALQFQRQVMQTAATAIFTVDARGTITGVNAEFTEMTGWEESAVLGRSYRDIVEWQALEAPDPFLEFGSGRVQRQTYHIRTCGGDRLTVLMNAERVADPTGEIDMGIGSFVDVSDLNRAQREAERTAEELNTFALNMELKNVELDMALKEAQEATKVKGEFLANVSHEIRTPLNGIIGMTELVLDTELSSQQREFLLLVRTSAQSLLTIINDILDFSKIEAGRMEMESITLDVEEVLRAALMPLSVRAAEKNLDLWCDLDPRIPNHLLGDPGRLRQIFVNLIGNAVKFTQHGHVGVRGRLVKEESHVVYVRFSVEDTGMGISQDRCEAIFESFTQADGSTTREFGGTGLGLAITRHLVELMDGHIGVESAPNQGSTFHFTIPMKRTSCALPDHQEPGDLPHRVLLAMEDLPSREVVARLLGGEDNELEVVSSVTEMLACLRRQQEAGVSCDAVIFDGLLCACDSRCALGDMLDLAPSLRGRLLVLTTPLDGKTAECCSRLGVATYPKPVTPGTFLAALAERARGGSEDVSLDRMLEAQPAPHRPGLRVLLVEDNEVNQRVAAGMLGKLGHHVWIAANGLEALELLDQRDFDVIFMDIQMPEMDGWEATRAIRQRETRFGGHLRIVAMTAHALEGDRQRCLEAGMDDYIPKPVQRAELHRALAEVDSGRGEPVREEGTGEAHGGNGGVNGTSSTGGVNRFETFDLPRTLDLLGQDRAFFCEAVEIFLQDGPRMMEKIVEACTHRDGHALERAAHTLKGSVSTFGAHRSMQLAVRLEDCGREGCFEETIGVLKELEREFERFLGELSAAAGQIQQEEAAAQA